MAYDYHDLRNQITTVMDEKLPFMDNLSERWQGIQEAADGIIELLQNDVTIG